MTRRFPAVNLTCAFAIIGYVAAEIAAFSTTIQNNESKIADLREKILAVPLQSPVHVSMWLVRTGSSHIFSGRLTDGHREEHQGAGWRNASLFITYQSSPEKNAND